MKGRLTASGEPYDARQLTQAHRTLPLDTRVRVTNLNNDRNHVCACAARKLDRRSWAGR